MEAYGQAVAHQPYGIIGGALSGAEASAVDVPALRLGKLLDDLRQSLEAANSRLCDRADRICGSRPPEPQSTKELPRAVPNGIIEGMATHVNDLQALVQRLHSNIDRFDRTFG